MRLVVPSLLGAVALVASACGPADNEGACKDMLIAGDLVITEVFADYAATGGGTGADEGKEWFEIYNATGRPVELEGLTIVHSRPDDSKAKSHVVEDVTIAPGQYFTLGNAAQDLRPAYVDYGYGAALGDLFNSDGGKLALKCGDTEIDAARYDSVKSGRSRQLTAAQPPDYTLNDDLANWCEAKATEFEPANFGTPGQQNDCAPVVIGQCNDGGTMRAAVAPEVGQLVITELMPSPNAVDDNVGEWFEARATADFDLNGVGLDRAGDSMAPNVIESPDCIRVTAGSYVVFARSADSTMNGGLPAGSVLGTFKFTMVGGTAASPGDVQIMYGTTVIDAVTWPRSSNGKALQLDPSLIDPVANDNPSNFCDATTPYGTGTPPDLGTPGSANSACSLLPPAGMCDANGTLRAIAKPAAGTLVISEFLANPAGSSDATREWVEIANTGTAAFDLNGLGIARAGGTANVVQSAACVSVAAGGFGLFARSKDPANNGMLPAVDATFAFSLVDTNGNVEIRDGDDVLDAITWPSVMSGVSRQLAPGSFSTTANDDIANFCPGTTPYGDQTNLGTPKAANVCP